jgi:hypothetical protein
VRTVVTTEEDEYFPPPPELRDLLRSIDDDRAAKIDQQLGEDRSISAAQVLEELKVRGDAPAPNVR